jgi:hypothetical protein
MAFRVHVCVAVITVLIICMIACSIINYKLISQGSTNVTPSDSYTDNVVNGIYLTTTTLSSVGYGDILPVTNSAKIIIAVEQMLVFLLGLGVFTISCSTI